MKLKTLFTRLAREEEGAAATEYAILVAFVAAAVAAAVGLFDLGTIFTTVSTNVLGWINSAPTAP
jgi:Flp pilus assembly pilin Flp